MANTPTTCKCSRGRSRPAVPRHIEEVEQEATTANIIRADDTKGRADKYALKRTEAKHHEQRVVNSTKLPTNEQFRYVYSWLAITAAPRYTNGTALLSLENVPAHFPAGRRQGIIFTCGLRSVYRARRLPPPATNQFTVSKFCLHLFTCLTRGGMVGFNALSGLKRPHGDLAKTVLHEEIRQRKKEGVYVVKSCQERDQAP